eukprot:TRINITY_DN8450_c0_g1_i3.p1 TRINITY_DN8450_c0_g1~~TRINITY_DN8450_c0_g1_i3.p1  ORF type:complete len:167 (+),score=9.95 TRINITY_DN8450_c0_g1_i3:192-692(+)
MLRSIAYRTPSPIMATTPTSTAPSHLHQVLAAPSGSTTWETACPQPHGTTLLPGWQRSAGGGARLRICIHLHDSEREDSENPGSAQRTSSEPRLITGSLVDSTDRDTVNTSQQDSAVASGVRLAEQPIPKGKAPAAGAGRREILQSSSQAYTGHRRDTVVYNPTFE